MLYCICKQTERGTVSAANTIILKNDSVKQVGADTIEVVSTSLQMKLVRISVPQRP